MNAITSINDARLLGIIEAARRAYPDIADVPCAKRLRDMLTRRGTEPDAEVDRIDADMIRLVLRQPLPDYATWSRLGAGDYMGRSPQSSLRGVMHYAGLSARQVAQIVGVSDGRTVRRWVATGSDHRPMPYAAWHTLLTVTRGAR